MNNLFEECVSTIEEAYEQLGHRLGWRFLSVSKNVLNNNPSVAFLSLNPGGSEIPADHPWASCESGCAYVAERWGSSLPGQSGLQQQVQMMFEGVGRRTGRTGRELLESSLTGHLVPFRSPRLADLNRKRESIDFGRQLWTRLLSSSDINPALLICMSRDIYAELTLRVLPAVGATRISTEALPTGWGVYTADVDVYECSGRNFALLRVPHLSTFRLFNRQKSRSYMNEILDKACVFLPRTPTAQTHIAA